MPSLPTGTNATSLLRVPWTVHERRAHCTHNLGICITDHKDDRPDVRRSQCCRHSLSNENSLGLSGHVTCLLDSGPGLEDVSTASDVFFLDLGLLSPFLVGSCCSTGSPWVLLAGDSAFVFLISHCQPTSCAHVCYSRPWTSRVHQTRCAGGPSIITRMETRLSSMTIRYCMPGVLFQNLSVWDVRDRPMPQT